MTSQTKHQLCDQHAHKHLIMDRMQVKDESSGYHYNAVHRWYYDAESGMYYGGEPTTWTKVPDVPEEAKYETMAAPSTAQGTDVMTQRNIHMFHHMCHMCCLTFFS